MTDHEVWGELAALAAAGALSPEEQRQFEDHARECGKCWEEFDVMQGIAEGLRRLPARRAPTGLAERTMRLVRDRAAEAAEQRWDNAVLAFLILLGWTVGLSFWAVARMLATGLPALLDSGFVRTLSWLAVSTVFAWMTAGAAAVALSRQRRLVRRSP